MNAYQLLAEIYRLVGNLDEYAIKSALSREMSTEIRDILVAIGRAAETIKEQSPDGPQPIASEPAIPTEVPSPDTGNEGPAGGPTTESGDPGLRLESLLRLAGNVRLEHLYRVLRGSGLDVKYNQKDSRREFVARAARKFRELPEERQNRILMTLRRGLRVDETEGWMDLIHPRRDQ